MRDKHSDSVTCLNCGWVHFEVSRAYIDKWQADWNRYWPTLDAAGREAFGLPNGPPTDAQYLACMACGGSYKNFRAYRPGDCPDGCTINPILSRNE